MSKRKPVTEIKLQLTSEHIAQADALRWIDRKSASPYSINISAVCPLAIMAREFFGRPCHASDYGITVYDSDANKFLWFLAHDASNVVRIYDAYGTVEPQTITLRR